MKNIFRKHKETDSMETAVAPQLEKEDMSQFRNSLGTDMSESTVCAADSRRFHIQYETSWTSTKAKIRVKDSDQGSELYTANAKCRKPQMTIESAATNTEIATVNFHCFKTRIEVNFRGQEVNLRQGWTGVRHSYASPTLNGENLTWQPRKKLDDLNMVLVNGQGLAIARFVPKYKSWKGAGELEMAAECLKSEEMMEEVVVMALAVVHYKETQRLASTVVVVT